MKSTNYFLNLDKDYHSKLEGGYSYYKKTRFDHQISKILSQEEITPKDFFIKEMQEVSSVWNC